MNRIRRSMISLRLTPTVRGYAAKRNISPKNDRQKPERDINTPRQIAFRLTKRLMELTESGRHHEAVSSVVGRADHRIFGSQPSSSPAVRPPFFVPRIAANRPEVWNVVLRGLARNAMAVESFRLYRQMVQNQRVEVTPETITHLFEACSTYLERKKPVSPSEDPVYRQALRLFREIQHPSGSGSSGGMINRVHVNAFLKVSSRAKDWETVEAIYRALCLSDSPRREEIRQAAQGEQGLKEFIREQRRKQHADEAAAVVRQGEGDSSESGGKDDWLAERLESFLNRRRQIKQRKENKTTENSSPSPNDSDDYDEFLRQEQRQHEVNGKSEAIESKTLINFPGIANIRPDTITYSTVLSAMANRGGDQAFRFAQQVWQHFTSDLTESTQQTLLKRTAYIRASLMQSADSASTNSAAALRRRRRLANNAGRRDIELSEEEFVEWRRREDAQREAEETFPMVQLDTESVNSMLLASRNAGSDENVKCGLRMAEQLFGSALNWSSVDRYLRNYNNNNSEEQSDNQMASSSSSASQLDGFPFPEIIKPSASQSDAAATITNTEPLILIDENAFSMCKLLGLSAADNTNDNKSEWSLLATSNNTVKPDSKSLSIILSAMNRLKCPIESIQAAYEYLTTIPGPQYRHYRAIRPDSTSIEQYIDLLAASGARPELACTEFDRLLCTLPSSSPAFSAFIPVMKSCHQLGDVTNSKRYWQMIRDKCNRRQAAQKQLSVQDKQAVGDAFILMLRTMHRSSSEWSDAVSLIKSVVSLQQQTSGKRQLGWWQDVCKSKEVGDSKQFWTVAGGVCDSVMQQKVEGDKQSVAWIDKRELSMLRRQCREKLFSEFKN